MQNVGQFGPGTASARPPTQFVPSEPSPTGGSTTTSLRQFRKRDVVEKAPIGQHQTEQSTGKPPMSESHVARVAPHNHYPPAVAPPPPSAAGNETNNGGYHRYHPSGTAHQFAGFSPQVKYSELAEPSQPNPISTSVIQKPKPKDYTNMDMCNVQPQHLTNHQQYSPDNGQYMHKDPSQGYPSGYHKPPVESHYFPKEPQQYQHQLHHAGMSKYSNPLIAGANMRKYQPSASEGAYLNKLSKMHPSMGRQMALNEHHLHQEGGYPPPMEQRAGMYGQQNHRYYAGSIVPSNPYSPNPNYAMNGPHLAYNYPAGGASCNYPTIRSSAQMASRYSSYMERSMSPGGRRTYAESMHVPPPHQMNYHPNMHQKIATAHNYAPTQYGGGGRGPEYSQHYQHRRVAPDVYQQACRPAQYMQSHPAPDMQELTESTVSPSDSLKKFIESWGVDEEPPNEISQVENTISIREKLREETPAGTVYMINASDVQYLDGIPIVTSENGGFQLTPENYQHLLKNGLISFESGGNQDRVVNLQIMEGPSAKPDCMLAEKHHQQALNTSGNVLIEKSPPKVDKLGSTKELVDKNCSPINMDHIERQTDKQDSDDLSQHSEDDSQKSPGSKSMPIIDFFAANDDSCETDESSRCSITRKNSLSTVLNSLEDVKDLKSAERSTGTPTVIVTPESSRMCESESSRNEPESDFGGPVKKRKRIFSVDDIIGHKIKRSLKDVNAKTREFLERERTFSSVKSDEEPTVKVKSSSSVVLELAGELLRISVGVVNGKTVINVKPMSDSTIVVDYNQNYRKSSVDEAANDDSVDKVAKDHEEELGSPKHTVEDKEATEEDEEMLNLEAESDKLDDEEAKIDEDPVDEPTDLTVKEDDTNFNNPEDSLAEDSYSSETSRDSSETGTKPLNLEAEPVHSEISAETLNPEASEESLNLETPSEEPALNLETLEEPMNLERPSKEPLNLETLEEPLNPEAIEEPLNLERPFEEPLNPESSEKPLNLETLSEEPALNPETLEEPTSFNEDAVKLVDDGVATAEDIPNPVTIPSDEPVNLKMDNSSGVAAEVDVNKNSEHLEECESSATKSPCENLHENVEDSSKFDEKTPDDNEPLEETASEVECLKEEEDSAKEQKSLVQDSEKVNVKSPEANMDLNESILDEEAKETPAFEKGDLESDVTAEIIEPNDPEPVETLVDQPASEEQENWSDTLVESTDKCCEAAIEMTHENFDTEISETAEIEPENKQTEPIGLPEEEILLPQESETSETVILIESDVVEDLNDETVEAVVEEVHQTAEDSITNVNEESIIAEPNSIIVCEEVVEENNENLEESVEVIVPEELPPEPATGLEEEVASSQEPEIYHEETELDEEFALEDEVFIEEPPAHELVVADPLEGIGVIDGPDVSPESPGVPLEVSTSEVLTSEELATCLDPLDTNCNVVPCAKIKPEVQILSPTSTNVEDQPRSVKSNVYLDVKRKYSTDNDVSESSPSSCVTTKAAKKMYEADLQVQHDIVSSSKKEAPKNRLKRSKRLTEKSQVKSEQKEMLKLLSEKRKRQKQREPLKTPDKAEEPEEEFVDFRELLKARKLKKLKKMQQMAKPEEPEMAKPIGNREKKQKKERTESCCVGCGSESGAKKVEETVAKAEANPVIAPKRLSAYENLPSSTSNMMRTEVIHSAFLKDPRRRSKSFAGQIMVPSVSELIEENGGSSSKKKISLADYVSRKRKESTTKEEDKRFKLDEQSDSTESVSTSFSSERSLSDVKTSFLIHTSDWEDSDSPVASPKQSKDTRVCLVEDFSGLIRTTTTKKPVIDLNELLPSADKKLQEYKEKVDSQLSSLNIRIPKVKPHVPEKSRTGLVQRFLNDEKLTPEEMCKIRKIISYKRSIQQSKNVKSPSKSPGTTTSEEKSRYEVRRSEDATLLRLKRVSKSRKLDGESDSGSVTTNKNVGYSVFNRLGEDGLPKIVFKREMKISGLRQPVVELVKLDLDRVKEKYNVTVRQMM